MRKVDAGMRGCVLVLEILLRFVLEVGQGLAYGVLEFRWVSVVTVLPTVVI